MINQQVDFLRAVLDAMPAPVFVVDDDVRIRSYNAAAGRILATPPERKRSGEALHCIHASETPEGCGGAAACRQCAIRNSVREAGAGGRVTRRPQRMRLNISGNLTEVNVLVTAAPFDYGGERLVLLVLEDITELTSLRRIIPMCASCRKIRDGEQYWQRVEMYFQRYLDIDVSHGICPECEARLYTESPQE